MEKAIALAQIMGPAYLILGLSILLYVKPWHSLISKWQEDHLLLFPLKFVYIILGLILINVYNVWAWNVWVLVTLTGWALLVKGAFYFLLPGPVVKKCLEFKKNAQVLYVGGLVGIIVGAVLTYYSYFV